MPSPNVVPLEALSSQAIAWMAFATGLVALTKQAYDIVRQRKREKREINEALDRQPLVREQLELGNTRAAIEQLSAIIKQMDEAKRRDDKRYHLRISELEARENELEHETERWEQKYNEASAQWEARHATSMADWEKRYTKLDERCRKITAVLRRHNWDIDDA